MSTIFFFKLTFKGHGLVVVVSVFGVTVVLQVGFRQGGHEESHSSRGQNTSSYFMFEKSCPIFIVPISLKAQKSPEE